MGFDRCAQLCRHLPQGRCKSLPKGESSQAEPGVTSEGFSLSYLPLSWRQGLDIFLFSCILKKCMYAYITVFCPHFLFYVETKGLWCEMSNLVFKWFSEKSSVSNLKKCTEGFPGGTVVENLPANAGDTGSSPGLGRSHMPLEQLGPWATITEPARLEPVLRNKRGPRTAMKSDPRLPQLKKALEQKRRPNTAKN